MGLRGVEDVPAGEQVPGLEDSPPCVDLGPLHRRQKKSKGSLQAFRFYLDELSSTQVEWNPWGGAMPEPEYVARSRVVTTSRVLLELAFGWQWYLGDRVTRQSLGLLEFQVPGHFCPVLRIPTGTRLPSCRGSRRQ